MSRSLELYLNDIQQSINKIKKYTKNMNLDQFLADDRTFEAVIYNLQIIGEASKNIPESIRQKYSQIEWKEIVGLRNIIVHTYFLLDEDILWDTIQNELQHLNNCIELIKNQENLELF
jgi:uncharacterized protein with HEPN domain